MAFDGGADGGQNSNCHADRGGMIVQPVDMALCTAEGGASAQQHAEGGAEAYPPTLYGSEGEDDGCKYHVQLETTCVGVDQDVTLTLTLNNLATRAPVVGAAPDTPDMYLASNNTHLAPNVGTISKEIAEGVYRIGPVRFDRTGDWIVRFHVFETCTESHPGSPHSHVAFYVRVP